MMKCRGEWLHGKGQTCCEQQSPSPAAACQQAQGALQSLCEACSSTGNVSLCPCMCLHRQLVPLHKLWVYDINKAYLARTPVREFLQATEL